jgi:uncharacterized membrane protein
MSRHKVTNETHPRNGLNREVYPERAIISCLVSVLCCTYGILTTQVHWSQHVALEDSATDWAGIVAGMGLVCTGIAGLYMALCPRRRGVVATIVLLTAVCVSWVLFVVRMISCPLGTEGHVGAVFMATVVTSVFLLAQGARRAGRAPETWLEHYEHYYDSL